MDTDRPSRLRFWLTTQTFGMLFIIVMGVLGMLVEANDAGCMVVAPTFFIVLTIVYPAARLRRFGAATAVFLLYLTAGSYIKYQMRWVAERQLASPWGALGWGRLGMLVGLVTDVTFRYLPATVSPGWREGAITGTLTGLALFITSYVAMTTLYASPASQQSDFVFFSSRALFSLPWMVLNGGFAGCCAMALVAGFGRRGQAMAAPA